MLVAEVTHNRRTSRLTEIPSMRDVVSLKGSELVVQMPGGDPGVVRRGAE
jgi:hypothetical protein